MKKRVLINFIGQNKKKLGPLKLINIQAPKACSYLDVFTHVLVRQKFFCQKSAAPGLCFFSASKHSCLKTPLDACVCGHIG